MNPLPTAKPILSVDRLTVSAGKKVLLNPLSLDIPEGGVFGLIGPSGAGKSTFLKSLNRLTELVPSLTVSGRVTFDGTDIYAPQIDPNSVREEMGILFQQPVVFPTTIAKNVLFGIRHLKKLNRRDRSELVESSLRRVALWEEVKDRLNKSALQLSAGQQQRLCLARTLAMEPKVLLMDEPTSALDPRSTESIEALIQQLSGDHTIILVTHNMRQTERICSDVAFIGLRSGVGTLLCQGHIRDLIDRTDIPELSDFLCCEVPGVVDVG